MAAKRKTPRKESDIRRKVGIRPVKKSFLIVCEGLNTEPEYFNSFRLTSANVKAVGKGLGTRTLVREAVSIRQEEQRKGKIYDYYWVVFDKDDFPENDFNTAIKEAEAEHFILYHGPLHRNQYSEMLTKLTGMPYSKKAGVASALYNLLFPKLDNAINNAESVLQDFQGAPPAKSESATTVFKLARLLKSYI